MQFGEWRRSGGIAVTIYNTLRVHKWEAEKLRIRIMEQVHGMGIDLFYCGNFLNGKKFQFIIARLFCHLQIFNNIYLFISL